MSTVEIGVRKLRKWNDLTEEVTAPPPIIAALATGRPEMLKLAPKGAATAEEVAVLYNVIRVLLETNRELQDHSQLLADQMKQVRLSLRGMSRQFDRLYTLASFTDGDVYEGDD